MIVPYLEHTPKLDLQARVAHSADIIGDVILYPSLMMLLDFLKK